MAKTEQKIYHYIYKIVNLINGKFYIGMHSTFDLNDEYMGSGKYLWNAKRKYGIENFAKEILEFLPDRKSLCEREKDLVNEDLIKDPNCMNLKFGGSGGIPPFNEEELLDFHRKGGRTVRLILQKKHIDKLINDSEYLEAFKKSCSIAKTKQTIFPVHTDETKKKMRMHKGKQLGNKNSQAGTMWIYNKELNQNKKIKKTDVIPEGWIKGRKIK